MLHRYIKYVCVAVLAVIFCSKGFAQTVDTITEEDYQKVAVDSTNVKESSGSNYNSYYLHGIFNEKNDTISSITQRNFIADTLNNLKKTDEDYWYANATQEKEQAQQKQEEGWPWWGLVKWIIMAVALIVLLVLFLINANIGIFTSSSKKIIRVKSDGEISDNIFEIEFENAIAKAKADKNYRLATRLLFLRLLRIMSEKNIIEYKIDKTNFDYLFTLSSSKYYQPFSAAVKNYEYTWYGQFSLNEQQFSIVQNDFETFQKQIGK